LRSKSIGGDIMHCASSAPVAAQWLSPTNLPPP
jgi:hypothetical protein